MSGLALVTPFYSWPVPPRLSALALDVGMFGGSVFAISEPDWKGLAGLVVAVGAILLKYREQDVGALKSQNAYQAKQIAALQSALATVRDAQAESTTRLVNIGVATQPNAVEPADPAPAPAAPES